MRSAALAAFCQRSRCAGGSGGKAAEQGVLAEEGMAAGRQTASPEPRAGDGGVPSSLSVPPLHAGILLNNIQGM